MKKKQTRYFSRSRLGCWLERLFGVELKARAAVQASTGVAVISLTIAAFIAANPYVAAANETKTIWVNPGTMVVIPYYERDGDATPAGYIVTDNDHSNICTMIRDDSAYTCQDFDLRR